MGFFTLVLIMNDRLISVALIMISSFQMSVTSVPSATLIFSTPSIYKSWDRLGLVWTVPTRPGIADGIHFEPKKG